MKRKSRYCDEEYDDEDVGSMLYFCSIVRGLGGYGLVRTINEFYWFINLNYPPVYSYDVPSYDDVHAREIYQEWVQEGNEPLSYCSPLIEYARAFVYYCDRIYVKEWDKII